MAWAPTGPKLLVHGGPVGFIVNGLALKNWFRTYFGSHLVQISCLADLALNIGPIFFKKIIIKSINSLGRRILIYKLILILEYLCICQEVH